jgi:hypothetical protein
MTEFNTHNILYSSSMHEHVHGIYSYINFNCFACFIVNLSSSERKRIAKNVKGPSINITSAGKWYHEGCRSFVMVISH